MTLPGTLRSQEERFRIVGARHSNPYRAHMLVLPDQLGSQARVMEQGALPARPRKIMRWGSST